MFSDVSKDLMQTRMIKSDEEIEIIKNGARIADHWRRGNSKKY